MLAYNVEMTTWEEILKLLKRNGVSGAELARARRMAESIIPEVNQQVDPNLIGESEKLVMDRLQAGGIQLPVRAAKEGSSQTRQVASFLRLAGWGVRREREGD
jgi:hypothetical protein